MTTQEQLSPSAPEHIVRFTHEDATHLADALDTLENIGGEEGRHLAEKVIVTAHSFTACIQETLSLDFEDTAPGTPWQRKETEAHNAFESSLRAIAEAGYPLPIDITILNHKNSNTLAVLLVAEETRRRHVVTT